jgi:SAM-dependent methyltransferase
VSTPDDPLHALNPTGRFSSRADDYARSRPSYPARAVDAVLQGLGDPASLRVVDLGAGTGIFARLLADRGTHVLALEPNADMIAAAASHPRVEWKIAAAESTGLDDGSCDLVTAAQAFHWFDPARIYTELARILRPGGRAAAIWNEGDTSDPFTRDYYKIVTSHAEDSIKAIGAARLGSEGAFARSEADPFFHRLSSQAFPYRHTLDRAGLLGRAASASYVPQSGPGRAAIEEGLTQLHARFADDRGFVRLAYQTRVHLAHRR